MLLRGVLTRAAGWSALRWTHGAGPEDAAREGPPAPERVRLVGSVSRSEGGPVASVELRAVEPGRTLPGADDSWSSLVLHRASGATRLLRGRGEGPWPVAAAIMGDVHSLARRAAAGHARLAARRS